MTGLLSLPAGWRLVRLDSVDSTNDEALRRVAEGERHGCVIVADRQERGRGRRGADWQSIDGNLFMTIVAESPRNVSPGRNASPGQLAYLAGIASARACRTDEIRLKWPNDLIFRNRKLGGILIEEGARARHYAIGIGINLFAAPFAPGISAISLSEAGISVGRDELVSSVCREFAGLFEAWTTHGFEPVRSAWLDLAFGIGKPIRARLADGSELDGVFTGIDADGALVLQRPDRTDLVISAGAVFFDEAADAC